MPPIGFDTRNGNNSKTSATTRDAHFWPASTSNGFDHLPPSFFPRVEQLDRLCLDFPQKNCISLLEHSSHVRTRSRSPEGSSTWGGGVCEKYRLRPTFSNIIPMRTTTTDDHYHRHQHHHHPEIQRPPSRPKSRHPQGYRPRPHDQPHHTQREERETPFLVVVRVLLKISRFQPRLQGPYRRREETTPTSWSLRSSARDPYAPTTPVDPALYFPAYSRNRPSVVDHLLTADDDHSLHRMRATMVVTVSTQAVDPKLEGHSSETYDS